MIEMTMSDFLWISKGVDKKSARDFANGILITPTADNPTTEQVVICNKIEIVFKLKDMGQGQYEWYPKEDIIIKSDLNFKGPFGE